MFTRFLFLLLLPIYLVTACSQSPPPTSVAVELSPTVSPTETKSPSPTLTRRQTQTPTATRTPTAMNSSTPTKTPTPTPTNTPSITPNPTPSGPQVVAAAVVNVRAGPGTDYAVVASLPPEVPLPIIGRNEASSWWQIEGPDGNSGWVADSVVTASQAVSIPLTAPPPLPTPTPIPAAATDFRIATWRLRPLELNGCVQGGHTIFITVVDVNGNPLNNIVVGDSWNNVETMTGSKGNGLAEIDLWSNTMEMVVKRDGETGQPYTSEVSFPFASFMTTIPNELMIASGHCANDLDCDWKRANDSYYCGGHYSWEVTFQSTRPEIGQGHN